MADAAARVRPEGPGDEARATCEVPRARCDAGRWRDDHDAVACEEPLEIRLGAASLAVVMRTPGHDEELATGFLVTERVVRRAADLRSVRHCGEVRDPAALDNVIRVVLAEGVAVDLAALQRNLYASSSCGICGKATLDNALQVAPPLDDDGARFDAALLAALPARLAAGQRAFARTGGMHAASLFAPDGDPLVVREDVGRHNAVDKVVGWALRDGRLPLRGHALLVSGRVSFEIVQKALAARIPLVAGVSAPTSLAVDLAARARIALVGFLRGTSFNVYGARERIAADPGACAAGRG